ncbi:acyl-CoA dehydrogenase [soil metagenome]
MEFSQEQNQFAEAVRDFCAQECGTVAQRDSITEGGTLSNSPSLLKKFAELGWLAISLPEEYGGGGGTFVDECIFLEETTRGLAPIHAYGTGLTAAQTYLKWGNDEQKRTVFGNLAAGKFEAISLSEPGAGSDLGGVKLKSEHIGDEYVINGQKTWCTAAHVAEHLLVLTREDNTGTKHQGLTLLMVPTSTPGLDIREIKVMDARTVNDIFFTDVRVPESAVVGKPKNAWKQLMRGLGVERLIIAITAVGAAQRSLDDAIAYISQREQFGHPISSYQAIRHRIADLATDIAFARTFVYDVAAKIDAGKEDQLARESAMAKMRCTEIAKNTALEAMQMMGGYGYTVEYGMEAQVRHSLAPTIYGGTNEIQREIIAKSLLPSVTPS